MTTDKRLAIENHSSDDIPIFGGKQIPDYLIVKQIDLASSTDNCSQVCELSIRVYPMRHSDNLLFIDFRIIDPCGNFMVFRAGSIGKSYILWTDTACSIVPDFYPDASGEDSAFLSDTLESTIRALIPYVRQSKMRTVKNKDKVKRSKRRKQLRKITR